MKSKFHLYHTPFYLLGPLPAELQNVGKIHVVSGYAASSLVAPTKAHKSRAGVKYEALPGSRSYEAKATRLPKSHPFLYEIETSDKTKYFQGMRGTKNATTRYRQDKLMEA